MTECRLIVPASVLGAGFPRDHFEAALALKPHAIAVDAGSTDSGPSYLGRGVSKMTREAVGRDLAILMEARERLSIPLVIGSCGTCGTDAMVDWVRDIVLEIARAEGWSPRIGLIYSEQDADVLAGKLAQGEISPLPPAGALTPQTLKACSHIVGLAGVEPIIEALKAGADIVLIGRATDTAVLCAVPILMGCSVGASWHAAKTAECGALCTTHQASGGVFVTVDASGFEIEPISPRAACTPRTVAAHLLYENANPYRMKEPGGELDTSLATYAQVTPRRVRVEGSQFHPAPYTMKLEGAAPAGFQTAMLIGLRDREILANLDTWLRTLEHVLNSKVRSVLGLSAGDYILQLRAYGWNAVAAPDPAAGPPQEVGVLLTATAASQATATAIARLSNPYLLHHPLRRSDPMPSFAYPFSPAEMERGELHEFRLNHVVRCAHPAELLRIEHLDMTTAIREAALAQAL